MVVMPLLGSIWAWWVLATQQPPDGWRFAAFVAFATAITLLIVLDHWPPDRWLVPVALVGSATPFLVALHHLPKEAGLLSPDARATVEIVLMVAIVALSVLAWVGVLPPPWQKTSETATDDQERRSGSSVQPT